MLSGLHLWERSFRLARVLAYHLAVERDVTTALAAYESERREATSAIILANREMDRVGAATGRPAACLRASRSRR
ncbi:hypothetical protein AC230_02760 [Streptomyces caatingaensis]|uniref:FAD-binding domain-containing protein n=1 Tax=Streptomyces caatingaensis TaxID=1678637 RepID=A0A0K9XLN2_9ACTN|nr:hypothetical protein AC230_02760 [Streptomyces caatingaensis]